MKRDNLHYSLNKLFSYNKKFMSVISAREAGKSTEIWMKAYNFYKKGRTTMIIKRLIADITDAYILSAEEILNKFDINVQLKYKKGSIKDGIVNVYIEEDDGDHLFCVIVALSNPVSRIKSIMVPNLTWMVFDEFICNTRLGEKYLKDEAFKFKEIYNTFQRECPDGLRVLFAGNPYSLYNPYFVWWGVNTKELVPGNFIVGDQWVVEVYDLKPELREFILSRNPLYQFDDSYTQYGFNGAAINDINIRIRGKLPDHYSLKHVFRIQDKYLGVYINNNLSVNSTEDFWVGIIDYTGSRRRVFCFDFDQLVSKTVLIRPEDRGSFWMLKDSIRNRLVEYESIECSYLMEEIYNQI